jgi:hypothetical protein
MAVLFLLLRIMFLWVEMRLRFLTRGKEAGTIRDSTIEQDAVYRYITSVNHRTETI